MTLTRNRRASRIARVAIGAFVAVALTGCIKMDIDLELDGDLANGSMIFAVDRSFLDMAGISAEEFLGEIDADEEIPDEAEVRTWEDGDYVGQEAVFDGVAIAEFNDPEFLSIDYDEAAGRYEVTGQMDMASFGDDSELGEMPPGMESMFGEFDMSISITFPGEVLEHNGTLDGSTVTWIPQPGEANEIHAVATDSGGSGAGGGFPVWLAVLLGVLVLGAVAAAVVLLSRRNKNTPQQEQEIDTAEV